MSINNTHFNYNLLEEHVKLQLEMYNKLQININLRKELFHHINTDLNIKININDDFYAHLQY